MAKLEIRMGPGPGLASKLGQKMGESEEEGESMGSEDEMLDAVYDAIEAKDREGFKEALMALLSSGD